MVKGHLSTKVPGVRLKPQPAQQPSAEARTAASSSSGAGSKRKRSRLALSDGDASNRSMVEDVDEGESREALNVVARPFAGLSVCFTGVNGKQAYIDMAHELGATCDLALTDTTTHLVAADVGSEKYKVALEHGLPILLPTWITSTHEQWRDGEDVDVPQLVASHRMPVFQGLRICISGFEGEDRAHLINLVNLNGGFHSRKLDLACTHLVSARADSAKVQFARRANADLVTSIACGDSPTVECLVSSVNPATGVVSTGQVIAARKEIETVWDTWLWDCASSGGRWPEAEYDVRRDKASVRDKRASIHHPPKTLALRGQDSTLLPESAIGLPFDIASANLGGDHGGERLEQAVVKRQKTSRDASRGIGLADEILESVIGRSSTGPAVKQVKGKGRMILEEFEDADDLPAPKNVDLSRRPARDLAERSLLAPPSSRMSSMSRSSSFTTASTSGRPSKSVPSALGVAASIVHEVAPSSSSGPKTFPFTGWDFVVRCGKRSTKAAMEQYIPLLGGRVLEEREADETGVDFVVVKLCKGRPKPWLLRPTAKRPSPTFVTEHWIERCANADALVPVAEHVMFTPIEFPVPLPQASSIVVCPTRLLRRDVLIAERLVEAIGGRLDENFTRECTHLICSAEETQGPKYERAILWDVPVISLDWLVDVVELGSYPDLGPYLLGGSKACDRLLRSQVSHAQDLDASILDTRPTHQLAPCLDAVAGSDSVDHTATSSAQVEPNPAPANLLAARPTSRGTADDFKGPYSSGTHAHAPKPALSAVENASIGNSSVAIQPRRALPEDNIEKQPPSPLSDQRTLSASPKKTSGGSHELQPSSKRALTGSGASGPVQRSGSMPRSNSGPKTPALASPGDLESLFKDVEKPSRDLDRSVSKSKPKRIVGRPGLTRKPSDSPSVASLVRDSPAPAPHPPPSSFRPNSPSTEETDHTFDSSLNESYRVMHEDPNGLARAELLRKIGVGADALADVDASEGAGDESMTSLDLESQTSEGGRKRKSKGGEGEGGSSRRVSTRSRK